MSRKVVHLTSVHGAYDTRIFHKQCKTLAKNGYQVVLVVPHEQDQQIDDISIRAVPLRTGRLSRMTRTVRDVYLQARKEDAELYHFHDPELIFVGLLLKLHGKKVIYDVHEDVPRQILSKHWIKPWVRLFVAKAVEGVEAIGARWFDGIVTVTTKIAKRFPAEKTWLVQNFPMLEEFALPAEDGSVEKENALAFIGDISMIRGVKQTVEALSRLPESSPVRLKLAGRFAPPELEEEFRSMPGWERVEYLGWLSRDHIRKLLAEVRGGIVPYHPVPNYIDAQPNKLFEYMAAGIPVIASDFPLWREFVAKENCGVLVNPQNVDAIARAIQELLDDPDEAQAMGRRGRSVVEERYNWEAEGRSLTALYQKLLPLLSKEGRDDGK
ncbi:glycosyltransferase family 4 protein [Brevibacillus ruminantium]|uniref:Glycosyltransferase family 4 protein n=1 Tax=Brevibacillus ruminantium TaxID=2950604 RepID=A0ABY4WKD1_9BACL|nr:glycosyltransferase family 4 protein [Brevibacillus ruminantium]USG67139.1 glycosyltransferase family 4 protein [Brevibacillus ruminantium]